MLPTGENLERRGTPEFHDPPGCAGTSKLLPGARDTELITIARRRGDRMSAAAAIWCDPSGGSPAKVRSSVRLVASVLA